MSGHGPSPEDEERSRARRDSVVDSVLEIGEGVAEIGGAVVEGAGEALSGCAGCSTVLVVGLMIPTALILTMVL